MTHTLHQSSRGKISVMPEIMKSSERLVIKRNSNSLESIYSANIYLYKDNPIEALEKGVKYVQS